METYSPVQARKLAARYAARVMELFEVIQGTEMSHPQAQELLRRCFADLIGRAEAQGGFVPETAEPDLEIEEQLGISHEVEQDLKSQVDAVNFSGAVRRETHEAIAHYGIKLEALERSSRLDLLSGIARAMIEREKLFRLRALDRIGTFAPVDQLFVGPAAPIHVEPGIPAHAIGPTVQQAVDEYLKHGERTWVRKTLAARRWQLGFFVEHVGPLRRLSQITAGDVRGFRDAICCLHRAHGRRRGATFAERQTTVASARIGDKTVANIFDPVKAFFRWAKSNEGLILTNPAEDVRFAPAKRLKGEKRRRSFQADELVRLFSAPIYTGCKSRDRRYAPGSRVIKDAKYWLPILGYYTGARLGELVQLLARDVHVDEDIPYLSIDEEHAVTDVDKRKHVKSAASVRIVPLHPDIMSLGFAAFVHERARRSGKGGRRLFDEFEYGSDGQASTVASKWFARFMDSLALTDSAICYHSFRHTAEDAYRDALTPQYVTDRIIGHSDGATSAIYGEGPSLETLYDALKRMRLKVCIPDIILSATGSGRQGMDNCAVDDVETALER